MNVTNMLALANRIEANPETYSQGRWCGSAYCLAGHAAILDGWTSTSDTSAFCTKDGAKDSAHRVGRRFLGLVEGQADTLFSVDWRPSKGSVPEQLRRYARNEARILCEDSTL